MGALLAFGVGLLASFTAVASHDVSTLVVVPTDDAFVDHGSPDANFDGLDPGGAPEPRMFLTDHAATYGAEDSRYVLLRFAFPPLLAELLETEGGRLEARLAVYVESAGCMPGPACDYDPVGGAYAVYGLGHDGWSERSVTFATAPAAGPLADAQPYAGSDRWYAFDVTSAVAASLQDGDPAVGFKLRIEHPDSLKYSLVHSRDMANAPLLVVSTKAPL